MSYNSNHHPIAGRALGRCHLALPAALGAAPGRGAQAAPGKTSSHR